VDDLDKLSQVIDAANAPKSAGLSIVGPRFDLKHREAAEQDVLRLAVEHALMRAQAIATGARRSLGAIQRIDDTRVMTDIPTPRPMAATRTAAAVETPITPGVIEIVAEVTVAIGIR
jgi:uncharacterized protein YggE